MITMDKTQRRIALTLFVVALVAASLLAWVDALTQAPIAQAQKAALHKALVQVLPEHSNDPVVDSFVYIWNKQERTIFPARDKQGKVTGYAWEQVAPDGYAGTIRILMGVHVAGDIVAIRITQHQETPGLGDGISKNKAWLDAFSGKTLENSKWKVKKDGGDFDQFTGATITPRAVVKAVHQGLMMYKQHRGDFYKAYKANQRRKDNAALKQKESGEQP